MRRPDNEANQVKGPEKPRTVNQDFLQRTTTTRKRRNGLQLPEGCAITYAVRYSREIAPIRISVKGGRDIAVFGGYSETHLARVRS